jgi:quinol monooxygenase YgiN
LTALPVVAVIKAKPGQEKIVEGLLKGLVAPTHQEAGCVRYVLHRSAEDPRTFVFVEKWESKDALEKHLGSAHIAQAFARQAELIEAIQVMPLVALDSALSDKGSF